jgi:hypothetical protein
MAALFALLIVVLVPVFARGEDGIDISGVWNSAWGPTDMHLKPNGDGTYAVTGSWNQGPGHVGKITGGTWNPTARTLSISYYTPWDKTSGHGDFTMHPNNLELNGTWGQKNAHGTWHLARPAGYALQYLDGKTHAAPPAVAPASTAAAAGGKGMFDISGNWNSNFGLVTLNLTPVNKANYTVSGSWNQGGGKIGQISNGKYFLVGQNMNTVWTPVLRFSYHQPWDNSTGTASFQVVGGGTQLIGNYKQNNAAGGWTLTRPAGVVPKRF